TLFAITATFLLGFLLLGRYIVTSRLGRILTAIRDAESRVMFCGYTPVHYKLFVWTLSAVICGVAGALYVPQVGIINPSEMTPANSTPIAIWTAGGAPRTLGRDRELGGGRRPRDAVRADRGRVRSQPRQELVHAGVSRVLAVRARP